MEKFSLEAIAREQAKPAAAASSGRSAEPVYGGHEHALRQTVLALTARSERIQTINQARSLIVTGPDDLRARFAKHSADDLAPELASLRPRPGAVVGYATRMALRELGRRVAFLDGQLQRLDELIVPLVTARAPGLLALYGVGHDTAAKLLIVAGDHPGGSAPKPHGRTCAPPPRSRPPRGRSPATGSTPTATARPTTPCTESSSPG
jgi:hypothetical protein